MQQPSTNAESSPASPSSSRSPRLRIPVSPSTAGAQSEFHSATGVPTEVLNSVVPMAQLRTVSAPLEMNSISAPKQTPPSQPGAEAKSLVHVPNSVSADNILERAAATRTLKVTDEDIGAFTQLLNQFREQDYLYVRRKMHDDPSLNHYAANHFAGVHSFATPEEPKH